jgi:SAM-dependent methyltransferase
MKINIGAGNSRIPDFVNIDYDSHSNPDYCLDIEKDLLPFEDNTVEFVIASHILEHLGEGYFHCLQELYRVCKHGAFIEIRVPHPRHDCYLADPTHRRPVTPLGLQLFSKKFNEYCRKTGGASSLLGEYFGVDFEIVEWNYIPDDHYRQKLADKPAEYVEEYVNQRANVVVEIYIKLMVIKE